MQQHNNIPDVSFLSSGDFWWCYAIIDEFDVLDGTFHIKDFFLRLITITATYNIIDE